MQPATPESLPIKHLDWEVLIPAMGRANRAVSEFSGLLRYLPDASLLMSPLAMREAVLSSRIEGTSATVTEVLRFEAGEEPAGEEARRDIEEIVNYRRALRVAERELRKKPFCLNLLLTLHESLMTSVRGQNKAPGQFRRVQNYIGRLGAPIERAEFIPPSSPVMMDALGEWEKYYHSEDRDSLVQLAIIHAQFEFLHPFLDGNGRLGRILIPLFLFNKGILSTPTFYISEYLEEHREEYVGHLRELNHSPEAWTAWCRFFLEAVTTQASWNIDRVTRILQLHQKLRDRMFDLTSSRYALALLDAMFAQPIFRVTTLLARKDMPSKVMVIRLLNKLVEDGTLKVLVAGSGRRPTVYSLHGLVRLCESRPKPSAT
jgi:Fic family protein